MYLLSIIKKYKVRIALIVLLVISLSMLICRENTYTTLSLLLIRFGNDRQKIGGFNQLLKSKDGFQRGISIAKYALREKDSYEVKINALNFLDVAYDRGLLSKREVLKTSQIVLPFLKEKNAKLVATSIGFLSRIACSEVVDNIVKFLHDDRAIVRSSAAMALLEPEVKKYLTQRHFADIRDAYNAESNETIKLMETLALRELGDESYYNYIKQNIQGADLQDRIKHGCFLIEFFGETWSIPMVLRAAQGQGNYPFRQKRVMRTLRKTTGFSFGFANTLSIEKREEIINSWLNWWEENKDKLVWNPEKQMFEVVESGKEGRVN